MCVVDVRGHTKDTIASGVDGWQSLSREIQCEFWQCVWKMYSCGFSLFWVFMA